MTGAERIAQDLAQRGVRRAFGIPGNQLSELLFAMKRCGIELIVARHEGNAAMMAETYARISRQIGVCITIPGPGVTNAYTGVLEAYNNASPVLLITCHQDSPVPTQDYSVLFHGLDQQSAFAPVTCGRARVLHARDVPAAMDGALAVLGRERPGPVFLEFSAAAFTGDTAERPAAAGPAQSGAQFDATARGDIARTVAALRSAKRPMILAGEGVHFAGASGELLRLAKTLHAPVTTTTLGKGAISEHEPLSVGSITDKLFSDKQVVELLNQADLLLAVGVKFTQTDTENWTLRIPCPLIHLDSEPSVINQQYRSEIALALPVRATLEALNQELTQAGSSAFADAVGRTKLEQAKVVRPLLMEALGDVMPADSILAADVSVDADPALALFKVREPWNFMFPGTSLVLGYALPAAIGAKFARPNSKVVALCGDGGFLMSSPDVATVMKYGLDIAIVVVNDSAYGAIKYKQERRFGENIGADLYNPDFMTFARAFGVHAARVTSADELKTALREVVSMRGPSILEIDKQVLVAR